MHADWQLNDAEIRRLQLEEKIGEGSYGKVHRARLPGTSSLYAVKVVEIDVDQDDAMKLKDTPAYKNMEQEISILKTCQCIPQIVRIFGVGVHFGEDMKAKVMVVMELCEHGSVSDILRRLGGGLPEPEIRVIVQEVLRGLKYLHDDKKIHRDVKAGNILLNKRFCPKLADFGISCELQNTMAKRETQIGSPYWMAPEVIKAGFGYNSKADIWSLGITCVEMAELQPPYFHIPPSRAMFVITTKPPTGLSDRELAKQFSKDFTDFLSACLTVSPKERPGAQALLAVPFAQRRDGEPSPAEVLEASLGPRIAEAQQREQQAAANSGRGLSGSLGGSLGGSLAAGGGGAGSSRRDTRQRRSGSGSLLGVLPRPSSNSNMLDQQAAVRSLEAATPSVDAFAGATMAFAGAGCELASPPRATALASKDAEVRATKASASIGGTSSSPSQPRRWHSAAAEGGGTGGSGGLSVEDDDEEPQLDPEEIRRRAREWVDRTVPMQTFEDEISSPNSVKGCAFDSDDESVATRIRVEAEPEAGAGGPSNSTPFFMQVLQKQMGT